MTRVGGTLLAVLAVLATVGCSGGKSRDTVPVTGTVTLDGKPVEGASVVFTPTGGGGAAASGKTDASGVYRLTTREPNDGAKPGTYLVAISKTETVDPTAGAIKPGMTEEELTRAAYEAYEKAGKAEPKVIEHLPAKYKNPASSGFKAEVTKGGKNVFDFPLTSK